MTHKKNPTQKCNLSYESETIEELEIKRIHIEFVISVTRLSDNPMDFKIDGDVGPGTLERLLSKVPILKNLHLNQETLLYVERIAETRLGDAYKITVNDDPRIYLDIPQGLLENETKIIANYQAS